MFILDRPKSDKPTFIFCKTTLADGRFKESLSVKILPSHWIKESERAVVTELDKSTILENKSINALLTNIENFIIERTREARHTGNHLTCPELSDKLQELTGKKKKKAGASFFDRCEEVTNDMRDGLILTKQGKRYSSGTLRNYGIYLRTFNSYNANLTFHAITIDFYRAFIKWCNDQDFSLNYIGQHLNKLIVLLKETRKRGYHNNTIYLDEDFKRLSEITEDISLSQGELDILYNKKMPNRLHDIARDWFIIGCYTGLRVSDITLLSDLNLSADTITIANEKTDIKVVIPMRPEVKAIIKKWGGLPPAMGEREINQLIKEVAEECKINETVLYFLTKGGTRKDFYLKKFEMISAHTARRSFITGLLEAGVSDNQVMALAGIKKHTTLLRYKKTKAEKTAEIMKDHPYFK
jgi:integrase